MIHYSPGGEVVCNERSQVLLHHLLWDLQVVAGGQRPTCPAHFARHIVAHGHRGSLRPAVGQTEACLLLKV